MSRTLRTAAPEPRVALLDMAGTTLEDAIDGQPFVFAAFETVFAASGIRVDADVLNPLRGLDKRQVIRMLLAPHGREDETDLLLAAFVERCLTLAPRVRPMPGAEDACRRLRDRGLFVALGTGLPHRVAVAMAEAAALPVDYVTSGEKAGGGRPGPQMARDVMARAGEPEPFDYRRLLKVGDTPADVREGKGVGALTVAVASGTYSRERLRREGPDDVLDSIAHLPAWLAPLR